MSLVDKKSIELTRLSMKQRSFPGYAVVLR